MKHNEMWIFVEGNDDKLFFEHILKPEFDKSYPCVHVWRWAQKPRKILVDLIHKIIADGDDYLFFADINSFPRVRDKKEELKKQIAILQDHKIFIVIKAIESWFMAGLDNDTLSSLGINLIEDTTDITKSKFFKLLPKKYKRSGIDFINEILKYYNTTTAIQKNCSFKYFYEKNFQNS